MCVCVCTCSNFNELCWFTMFYLYYSVSRVTEVMKRVDAAKICSGNPDNKYAVLHTIRKGHFMDSSGALMFKTCGQYS